MLSAASEEDTHGKILPARSLRDWSILLGLVVEVGPMMQAGLIKQIKMFINKTKAVVAAKHKERRGTRKN